MCHPFRKMVCFSDYLINVTDPFLSRRVSKRSLVCKPWDSPCRSRNQWFSRRHQWQGCLVDESRPCEPRYNKSALMALDLIRKVSKKFTRNLLLSQLRNHWLNALESLFLLEMTGFVLFLLVVFMPFYFESCCPKAI
jgi:hypothetical protein